MQLEKMDAFFEARLSDYEEHMPTKTETGDSTMVIEGCHEGKHTPRLSEVKCPRCGEWVDVFILMGGRPAQTGTLASDEKCTCGNILPAGSYESDYEQ